MTPVLVLGLGNPLRGDDGVGQRVLTELQGLVLGSQVTLIDGGTAGLEIVNLMAGCDSVVIIDALDFGAPPGKVTRMTLDAAQMRNYQVSSNALHSAGLFEALALAEALGTLPASVTLVGVQPASLAYVPSLSGEVGEAVPEAVRIVMAALAEFQKPAI